MVINTGASPSQLQENRVKIAEFHKKHMEQKNNQSKKGANVYPSAQTILMSPSGNAVSANEKEIHGNTISPFAKNTPESREGGTGSHSISTRGTDASIYNLGSSPSSSTPQANISSSSAPNLKQHPNVAASLNSQNYPQTSTSTGSHKFGVLGSNNQPEKQLSDLLASTHLWTETSSGYASDAFAEDDGTTSQISDGSRDKNDQGVAEQTPGAGGQGRRTWTTPGSGSMDGKGILSHKGTIRGVQNKVRTALIAFNYDPDIETPTRAEVCIETVSSACQNSPPSFNPVPSSRDWCFHVPTTKEKVKTRGDAAKNGSANFSDEEGRVVLYTTSSGIIPEVNNRCCLVRNILMFHRVKFEERDLFLSKDNVKELETRMRMCRNAAASSSSSMTSFGGGAGGGASFFPSSSLNNNNNQLDVPQVFVDGVWLGNAKKIEELNETGELKKTFKRFEKINADNNICAECWGYTYVMCKHCNGSKKSTSVRNGFTDKFIALKCTHCDPNGLQRCPAACYMK